MARSALPNAPLSALLVLAVLSSGCDTIFGTEEERLPELVLFTAAPAGASDETAREVFVVRPDGSGLQQLTDGAFAFGATWSPDGRMIAFTTTAEADPNVYVMNADGSELRPVTTGTAAKYHVTWLPGGERLGFAQMSLVEELVTVAVDGSDLTVVRECPDGCKWPTWSPDGSRVAFVSWPDSWPFVFLWSPGDEEPVPVASGATYEHQPAWSPDGSMLVFMSHTNGELPALTLAAANGSVQRRLPHEEWRESPTFSRDGSRILYFERAGYWADDPGAIYSMDLEGGDVRRVIDLSIPTPYFVTPRWRP